ncbi:MAG: GntR family transcriptional regulator [Acidisphaera sp.]|nr:GntR family transcriptional regulator [Acidisphaera sp.]
MIGSASRPGSVLRVQENQTLREKTLHVLREAILSEHFRPGQRLVERDLCEQTGVSRSSVREALRHLESEGLVESRGTRGMFVTSLTAAAAIEIYEVRAALEAEAARHFAERATAGELNDLEKTYAAMLKAGGKDAETYRKATDRFFDLLFAGAHNRTADVIMRSLRARISFLRATTTRLSPPLRRKASIEQMREIVDALHVRDGERAAAACRRFVARSAAFAAQCLAEAADQEVA